MKTLEYYDLHAQEFVTQTQTLSFAGVQNRFLMRLPQGGHILDFGCGSGRDALCFLKQGFKVTATDGSEKMCRLASEYTGIPVRQMRFRELNDIDVYDGIWACASILHLPKADMPGVFMKMRDALKEGGLIYTSFKYGDFEGEIRGRHFSNYTWRTMQQLIAGIDGLEIEEVWMTPDSRPDRADQQWLNCTIRKTQRKNKT